ncbi:hypothetical protein CUMW_238810 [Citrus unshiu]|uniref:Uncharacterized protein n=1 Tax=Citrus unshiu TaxID=55188 RepID=A0A2H5QKG6_CITUN|nr:hypothetical protein CUMW_238810 [Citrus unshiu]
MHAQNQATKSHQVTLPCHQNSTSLSLKARPSRRCSEILLAISFFFFWWTCI